MQIFSYHFTTEKCCSVDATKAEKVGVAALLNVIGRDALDMYETFLWESEGGKFQIAKVLEKFEERDEPARNEIFERYNFFKRNQHKGELLDAYITTLLKDFDSVQNIVLILLVSAFF